MGILHSIKVAAENRTSYRAGLLQSKAYRILKQRTIDALKEYGISSVHWAFLGILYDVKEGMRASDAAAELGVEAPFVTRMLSLLEKKGWIESVADKKDSRAKILRLTTEGRAFVASTETHVREKMRPLLTGLDRRELMAYLTVLEKIITNGTDKVS